MTSITNSFPKEIFALIAKNTDIETLFKHASVSKNWALLIIDNNQLWQNLIRRDFKITPGKYLSLEMSREEYKLLFLHRKKIFAKGGVYIGKFATPKKNKHYVFPELHVDAEARAFLYGSSNIHTMAPMPGAALHLTGSFLCSKNGITLVVQNDANNTYQLLDSQLSPMRTIRSQEKLLTFEILEQGLLTGSDSGNIKLWNLNENSSHVIAKTEGMILNLFSTQLSDGKAAILAWHYTDSFPTISLFGLDGEKLEPKNLEFFKNKHINTVKKLPEDKFAIVLNKDNKTDTYIISTKQNPIPLSAHSQVKNVGISVSEGKIYILEDDKPKDGYEKSIRIWDADGQYLDKTTCQADKIDIFNGKIYSRNAHRRDVNIYDLNTLPSDGRAWHLDLNNFNAFAYEDKNQICGIFYCLIKSNLLPGEDYFGCARDAFYGEGRFASRFADSLRSQALAAHVLLKDMSEAIAAKNEAVAIFCFDQLPKSIQDSLGWGMWVFEGMQVAEVNFGSNFFRSSPTHNSVKNSLHCFRENGCSILSYLCRQEILAAEQVLNNSPSQEAIIDCLQNLSLQTQDIVIKCIEVVEGFPRSHGTLIDRYSSDNYINGLDKTDPLILSINNLVNKI